MVTVIGPDRKNRRKVVSDPNTRVGQGIIIIIIIIIAWRIEHESQGSNQQSAYQSSDRKAGVGLDITDAFFHSFITYLTD